MTALKVAELGIVPDGWLAPRKEFLLAGFRNEHHAFAFDAIKVPASGETEIWRAKCTICGTDVPPYMEDMKLHAILHLAVELAKETGQK